MPKKDQPGPSRTRIGTIRHKKSSSTSSLAAFPKVLPKAVSVPTVNWGDDVLEKQKHRLSAFAPPFLQNPLKVDREGEFVIAPLLSPRPRQPIATLDPQQVLRTSLPPEVSAWSKGPPASVLIRSTDDRKDGKMLLSRKLNIDEVPPPVVPKLAEPPKLSVWARGPPKGVKKVTIAENDLPKAPASASLLAPPQSAVSLFGTESDPATPWDPALRREKNENAAQAAQVLPNLEYAGIALDIPPPFFPASDSQAPFHTPAYPWGMPMSPMSGSGHDVLLPSIPGGLGVMWTPAGWAVQDAAMKHSLRAAEVKAIRGNPVRNKAKSYYKGWQRRSPKGVG